MGRALHSSQTGQTETRLTSSSLTHLCRKLTLIQKLKPIDRQVILSYLEGMDAASIGEITGISPANVAMKIHRVKSILARRFQKGEQYAG